MNYQLSSQNHKKDYFWNSLGVFFQNAISPILLIFVTRINSIEDSGSISFALAVALIFWAFGIWGGRTYQVSDVKNEFSNHGYVMVRIILGLAMIVFSLVFCLLNNYGFSKTAIILAFVVFKFLESFADVIYGILQTRNQLFISGKSLFIKAMLGAAAFLFIDLQTKNLFLASLALIFINLITIILYDLPKARKSDYIFLTIFKNIKEYQKEAIKIIIKCAPVATVVFLSMFSLNIPRYFLDKYHPDEIGFFGILVMPLTVLGLVIMFLLQPKIVHLSKLFDSKKYKQFQQETRRIFMVAIFLGFSGVILTFLLGVPILNFVFGLDFESHKNALMLLVIGAVASAAGSIYMNIFTIIRHFKVLFYTLVITNIGLLALCIIIVNQYGLLGAVGLFTVVSYAQSAAMTVAYLYIMKTHRQSS